MPRRITVLLAALAAVAVSVFMIGSAGAAPAKKRLKIVGGVVFKPGEGVTDNQRFAPRVMTVDKGDKVVLRNRARSPEDHTISVVRRNQLPNSFECGVCESIGVAHEFNPETGQVGKRRVNVGAAGFDRPGDSIVLSAKEKVSFRVTADEGKNLNYLCAVHPWMQGKLRVR
jgi:plastocyanin